MLLYYIMMTLTKSCREATRSCNKNVTWKGLYDFCNLSKYPNPPLSTSPDHELYFIHMNIVLRTNLLLMSTLHSVIRYLIVCSFPHLTATPSGVSPSLSTAPIVVGALTRTYFTKSESIVRLSTIQ